MLETSVRTTSCVNKTECFAVIFVERLGHVHSYNQISHRL